MVLGDAARLCGDQVVLVAKTKGQTLTEEGDGNGGE